MDLKYENELDRVILRRCGLEEDAKIVAMQILKPMGFKNQIESSNLVSVKKAESDERQNNGSFI